VFETWNGLIGAARTEQASHVPPLCLPISLNVKDAGVGFCGILITLMICEPASTRPQRFESVGVNFQGLVKEINRRGRFSDDGLLDDPRGE